MKDEKEIARTEAQKLDAPMRFAVLKSAGWQPAYMLDRNHNGSLIAFGLKRSCLFDRKQRDDGLWLYALNQLGQSVALCLKDSSHEG